MVYGCIKNTASYTVLTSRPVWAAAFGWLRSAPIDISDGDFPLEGFPGAIVRVMTYETKPLSVCRYETHRKFVDLQYTFSGAEKIAWLPRQSLALEGDYTDETDLQFYKPAPSESIVHKLPGRFSVFYPEDAHRPQIYDEQFPSIHKAVIKIPIELV
ncbi:YhcH/YjgK/YiaL family protein [bacterium]|nr:YhcH/YjgK/YiaL family protein [bacterium]